MLSSSALIKLFQKTQSLSLNRIIIGEKTNRTWRCDSVKFPSDCTLEHLSLNNCKNGIEPISNHLNVKKLTIHPRTVSDLQVFRWLNLDQVEEFIVDDSTELML